jgi:hypothetical protein
VSHTTTIKSSIIDLDALDAAVRNLDGQFIRNVTEFQQYSGRGACDHVIRLPGVRYEVGVAASEDRSKFDLLYDPYGFGESTQHDGHKLERRFGKGLCTLTQHYNVERTARLCQQHGKQVRRVAQPNGTISLYAS